MNLQTRKRLFYFFLTFLFSHSAFGNNTGAINHISTAYQSKTSRFAPSSAKANRGSQSPIGCKEAALREVHTLTSHKRLVADRELDFTHRIDQFIKQRDTVNKQLTKPTFRSNKAERVKIVEASRSLARRANSLAPSRRSSTSHSQVDEASQCLSLADFLLDSALYFNPVTGVGAGLYAAVTGRTLTGTEVTDSERCLDLALAAFTVFPVAKAVQVLKSAPRFFKGTFSKALRKQASSLGTEEGFRALTTSPEFVTKARACFGLGPEWSVSLTKSKPHVVQRGFLLRLDQGTHLRVMPPNPRSPHPMIRKGAYVKLHKDGVMITTADCPHGHFPLGQITPAQVQEVLR